MFDSMDDFGFSHEWDQAEQMATEAFELYEHGQMAEAMEKLDGAIRQGPEHGEWFFNMGLTLDALEEYDKALEFYERALECAPDDVEIMNCLGVDYTRTAQYDMALTIFERIEQLDPSFEPCYCNRIITYTEMEQHDKAEQMFYLAQQIEADCALCYYNIGNSLFSQQDYERAIWCWEKCAEIEPNHPQIHYRLAQACWVSGQGSRAREEFLIEIRKNPANLDILLDFGLFLLESGNFESAREKFNRILEFDPAFAPAHFYLGEVFRLQADTRRADRCYHKAIECDAAMSGPRFRLAELYTPQGRVQKSIQLLRAEFRLGVDDIDVLKAMGWMFLNADELTDACNYFIQALAEVESDYEPYFGLSMTLLVHGDYSGAFDCIEQALMLDANRAELYLCAGWLHYKLAQWDAALDCVQRCRQIHPKQQPYRSRCQQLAKSIRWNRFLETGRTFLSRFSNRKKSNTA